MKRGDKVSILGENKPEIFWAELAVQAAGGTAVDIYTDCTPPEVKFFVTDSDSNICRGPRPRTGGQTPSDQRRPPPGEKSDLLGPERIMEL